MGTGMETLRVFNLDADLMSIMCMEMDRPRNCLRNLEYHFVHPACIGTEKTLKRVEHLDPVLRLPTEVLELVFQHLEAPEIEELTRTWTKFYFQERIQPTDQLINGAIEKLLVLSQMEICKLHEEWLNQSQNELLEHGKGRRTAAMNSYLESRSRRCQICNQHKASQRDLKCLTLPSWIKLNLSSIIETFRTELPKCQIKELQRFKWLKWICVFICWKLDKSSFALSTDEREQN